MQRLARFPKREGMISRPSKKEATQPGPQIHRIVKIEMRSPLRALPSKSPFRFVSKDGMDLDRLHAIFNHHQLIEAYPSFRLTHPLYRHKRPQPEQDELSRFVILKFPAALDVEPLIGQLRELSVVAHAAEFRGYAPAVFPVDPLLGDSDLLPIPADFPEEQWYIFRCNVDRAWRRISREGAPVSGDGVIIADVDHGFFLQHEDLEGNIDFNFVHNAFDGSQDVSAGREVKHGTGVLGLAGAVSNDKGIAGVAFGAKLWPIQTDAGNGPPLEGDPVANAILWITQQDPNGHRVVVLVEVQTDPGGNIEQHRDVATAIQLAIGKGYVVCVAAGNGGKDVSVDDDGNAIPVTGSILVAATLYNDLRTNPRATAGLAASNWGDRVAVCAPGDSNHDITCSPTAPNYTSSFGGTSGAAAKVAGTIALMLQVNPNLTQAEVKSILSTTGSDPAPEANRPIGKFLDADAAVAAATTPRTTSSIEE